MYQNPYMNYQQNFNSQSMNERIDNQIAQLQQMKEQMKNNTQPAINQTIQLSPTSNNTIKYVDDVNEVSKELVFGDTPFFSKDMSIVWIKNSKGDIKTYELKEIVPMDERDLLIQNLQMQVNELRKEVKNNAKSINANDDESNSSKESTDVSISRTSKKK
jgi:hypothetical protein